ncbi:lipoprotein signal peptidase [Flavobacterium croceum]|uniref:lipoprotein signal peptidase n=1 Tax=Flavobacterium croceum TaxID=370975 RepID=UPI0024A98626|nr:lipoprotein signal peptidase [Flavobacterium croceum]
MKIKHAIYIIILVLFIDQFSKIYVKTNFFYGESVDILKWFKLTFIENEGMAWGTEIPGEYGKLFLTLFRITAVVGIAYWLWESSVTKKKSKYLIVAISLIMAGALGNIIDSVFYGVIFDKSTPTHLASLFAENNYGTWFHGRVVDMFYFPIWHGFLPQWIPVYGGKEFTFFNAIFNVADFSISTGVGILIFFNKKAFDNTPANSTKPYLNNDLEENK